MSDRTTYTLVGPARGLEQDDLWELESAMTGGYQSGISTRLVEYTITGGLLTMTSPAMPAGMAPDLAGRAWPVFGRGVERAFKVWGTGSAGLLGTVVHYVPAERCLVVASCDDQGRVVVPADVLCDILARHDDSPLAAEIRNAARLTWDADATTP